MGPLRPTPPNRNEHPALRGVQPPGTQPQPSRTIDPWAESAAAKPNHRHMGRKRCHQTEPSTDGQKALLPNRTIATRAESAAAQDGSESGRTRDGRTSHPKTALVQNTHLPPIVPERARVCVCDCVHLYQIHVTGKTHQREGNGSEMICRAMF